MEVVPTANLVSWETKKNKSLQFSMHKYNYEEAIRSFRMAELWKSSLRKTYMQNNKIKTSNKLKEKYCFPLEMHYFFQ